MDSSVVVACMREVTSQPMATFSIGFGRMAPSFVKLPYARVVAERFATEHHEEILEPKVADLLLPIVHHFEEPFADSSSIPTFVVAQSTARHVKMALFGIGGMKHSAGTLATWDSGCLSGTPDSLRIRSLKSTPRARWSVLRTAGDARRVGAHSRVHPM
jgi:asparagine synthase (glutamine-hydrolysing)